MQPNQSPRPGSAASSAPNHTSQRTPSVDDQSQDLTDASFSTHQSAFLDPLSVLQNTAARLHCCPFRAELMNRIEEALHPRSPTLEVDITHAAKRLDAMNALERVELFQKIFTPELWERPGWALPSAPFISVTSSTVPDEVKEHATRLIRAMLDRGTLPGTNSYEAIQALGRRVPNYKTAEARAVAMMGIAATAACALIGPPILPVIVGASAMLYVRHLARRPNPHGAFATGCLLEAIDANRVLHNSDTIPTLMSTMHSYFNDPGIPQSYQNSIQGERFLAARTLRIFGYSNIEIFAEFMEREAFCENGSSVLTVIAATLRAQEITLEEPLTTIFENPTQGGNANTISLLEDVNAAHFTWAFRDKDKIRHEVANMILGTAHPFSDHEKTGTSLRRMAEQERC